MPIDPALPESIIEGDPSHVSHHNAIHDYLNPGGGLETELAAKQDAYDPILRSITAAEALAQGDAVAYADGYEPRVVQVARTYQVSGASITATFAAATAAGNDIFVFVWNDATGPQAIANYTQLNWESDSWGRGIYRRAGAPATTSVTANVNNSGGASSMIIVEVAGVTGLTGTADSAFDLGTTVDFPSLTTTNANALVLVASTGGPGNTISGDPSGYTRHYGTAGDFLWSKNKAATGAESPTISGAGDSGRITYIVAIYGAGQSNGYKKVAAAGSTNFVGFAKAAISSGATGDIVVAGSTGSIFSGLTPGSPYYLGAAGAIAATGTKKVGVAVSATELVMSSV